MKVDDFVQLILKDLKATVIRSMMIPVAFHSMVSFAKNMQNLSNILYNQNTNHPLFSTEPSFFWLIALLIPLVFAEAPHARPMPLEPYFRATNDRGYDDVADGYDRGDDFVKENLSKTSEFLWFLWVFGCYWKVFFDVYIL